MEHDAMLEAILASLRAGTVRRSVCGRRWTAVEADVDGVQRCGLAATLGLEGDARRAAGPIEAGAPGIPLAQALRHAEGPQASLAAAALNALLPPHPEHWVDARLEDVLRQRGSGRAVAMVGHFPFADDLKPHVASLTVLERRPRPGDLPEQAAADILPASDLIVITGLAFVNRTLPRLLALCPPHAYVILAGASVPLSPILFGYGVHMLCGSVVEHIEPVLQAVALGEGFRAVHPAGVRRVAWASRDRA
jgi:hypothetical protein